MFSTRSPVGSRRPSGPHCRGPGWVRHPVWGVTGPVFGFSDTWQLVIDTGTTIVTFFMVFLIQTTQNRESEAIRLKLDELIRPFAGPETNS